VLGGQLSYRRRRLLIVLLAVAVVAGGITAAIIAIPTGKKIDRSSVSHPPAGQYRSELPHRSRSLSTLERRHLISSVFLFVSTAVTRRHVERSWPIVDPSLRAGETKEQWQTGNIPVVPFPAAAVGPFRITSVVGKDAIVEIVLIPRPSSHLVKKTFLMELKEQARHRNRWAISSWTPEGITYSLGSRNPPSPAALAKAYKNQSLSVLWIILPIGILLVGILLLPAGVFAREAYRTRRAEADAAKARS